MKHKFVLFVTLAVILGGGYWFNPWRTIDSAPRYRTEKVVRGPLVKTVSANGTLDPVVLVNVGTQISGVVYKLNVDFNDRVRKDQVLAEIDPSLTNAQLQQSKAAVANAQATLKLAEANENRARQLYSQDYIAKADWDQAVQVMEVARAQLDSARGQLKHDQTNLSYTVIKSPVSGVVVSRNVDIGQTVAASFQTPTLFTIAQDLQQMQIDTSVAEADVGGVKVGQAVNFTVDAYPDRIFKGSVRRIRLDSKVLQNVVTYDVVIDVNNPEEILLPGMTAFVSIVIEQRNDVLKLPLAALKFRPIPSVNSNDTNRESKETSKNVPQPKVVYRLENNQAVPVPVIMGIADSKYVELVGGDLKENDEVIIEDQNDPKFNKKASAAQGNFRVKAF